MTTVRCDDVTLHGGDHSNPATIESLIEELQSREYDVIAVEQPAANLSLFTREGPYRYDGRDVRLAYTYAEDHDMPLAALDDDEDIPIQDVEHGNRIGNAALLSVAGYQPEEVIDAQQDAVESVLSLPLDDIRGAREIYRSDDKELFENLVDSRDATMAARINGLLQAGYSDVLAVIGQLHVAGVYDYFRSDATSEQPPVLTP